MELTSSEPALGAKIGRFVIEGKLGQGGMGIVYAAHDRELDRRIALKVLRGSESDEGQRMRLLREGQAMARITHPNVITVHEAGIEGQLVFLAQELLDGGTLREWLARPRPHHEILDRFRAAGRGLAAAHAAGLVHRDFKPDNVLLGKDGRVRVADFGLARALDAPILLDTIKGGGKVDPLAMTTHDTVRDPMAPMTQTGAVMGTPMYMAPEQHNGEVADERSDQFSFCVALYEALYGAVPFAGKTAVALADAVIHGRIEPPTKGSKVSSHLRRVLVRGLSTKPADRYPSMEALLADLAHDPGRKLRRAALVLGLVGVIAVAVVGGWLLRSRATTGVAVGGKRSVAVLGFKADKDISNVFSQLVATELAGGDGLRVSSPDAAHQARVDLQLPDSESLTPEMLDKVRNRLGVDAVVVGSFKQVGSQLTVVALVEDLKHRTVKQIELKGSERDLPALAARLAPRIRDALGVPAYSEVAQPGKKRDPAATLAYSEGLHALRVHDYAEAKRHLQSATEKDPAYAPAHLALAHAYEAMFDRDAARAAAKRAIETSSGLPVELERKVAGEAHELLGDLAKARASYRDLFTRNPDELEYGLALVRVQPLDEQSATIATLRKLAVPVGNDPRIDAAEAELELRRGNHQRALELAQRGTTNARERQAPSVIAVTRRIEGQALTALHKLTEAAAALDEANKQFDAVKDLVRRLDVMELAGELAVERGELDEAHELFQGISALALQSGQKARASIALSSSSLVLALRGQLDQAQTRLREAEATAQADATARSRIDLSAAAIAFAKGDHGTALERSTRCAAALRTDEPALAALCLQIQGDVLAEKGDVTQARNAYDAALEVARAANSLERVDSIQLGLAQLEIDAGAEQAAHEATNVEEIRKAALARGAVPTANLAAVVLARAKLRMDQSRDAYQTINDIKPETIQSMRIRVQHQLTLAHAGALEDQREQARTLVDAARADASRAGAQGLVFEARLVQLAILFATNAPEAATERDTLVREATDRGFGRIAKLALTIDQ